MFHDGREGCLTFPISVQMSSDLVTVKVAAYDSDCFHIYNSSQMRQLFQAGSTEM